MDFDGIVVLTHWRIANSLQNDRLRLPTYSEIAKKVYIKSNKQYTKSRPRGGQNLWNFKKKLVGAVGIPSDSQKKGTELKGKEEKRNEKNRNEKSRVEVGSPEAGEDGALAQDTNSD